MELTELVTCSKAVCKAIFPALSLPSPLISLPCTSQCRTWNVAKAGSWRSQRYYLAPKAISEEAFLPMHFINLLNNQWKPCFLSFHLKLSLHLCYLGMSCDHLFWLYEYTTHLPHTAWVGKLTRLKSFQAFDFASSFISLTCFGEWSTNTRSLRHRSVQHRRRFQRHPMENGVFCMKEKAVKIRIFCLRAKLFIKFLKFLTI